MSRAWPQRAEVKNSFGFALVSLRYRTPGLKIPASSGPLHWDSGFSRQHEKSSIMASSRLLNWPPAPSTGQCLLGGFHDKLNLLDCLGTWGLCERLGSLLS